MATGVKPFTKDELDELKGGSFTPDEQAELAASSPASNSTPQEEWQPALQDVASKISSVVDPSLKQLGAAGMDPYKSATEPITSLFPKANGHPLSQAWESVKALLAMPSRFSSTMGSAAGPVSEKSADYLGSIGVPSPLSAALSMAAGAASDPRSYIMMGAGHTPEIEIPGMGGQAGEQIASDFWKYGIESTPAQATQSALLQKAENLLNRHPYSAQTFENFYKQQLADADNIRSALINKVGNNEATDIVAQQMRDKIDRYLQNASPEDAAVLQDKFGDLDAYMKKEATGQFGKGMLAQASKIARDKADQMYAAVPIPKDSPIQTPNFSAQAKQFLADELQANPVDQNVSWIKRLTSYAAPTDVNVPDLSSITPEMLSSTKKSINDILDGLGTKETSQIPFGGTQMTMKNLRDLRIQNDPGYLLGSSGQGNRFAGYAAKLRQALATDIQDGANALSPEAGKALHDANANYAQYKQTFTDPFIKNLLKNNPEDFLDHAIQPKDVTNVAKLKTILGEDNFKPVKENLLANMLVNKSGDLSPSSFSNKVDRIGMPTLAKVFDPDELTEIVSAHNVMKHIMSVEQAAGGKSPTAGVLMTKSALVSQPSAALMALFTGHPMVAAGIGANMILPKLMAKVYLSAPVRDMLIHGISAPDSAMATLGIMGKTATMMGLDSAVGPDQQPQGNQ